MKKLISNNKFKLLGCILLTTVTILTIVVLKNCFVPNPSMPAEPIINMGI